MTLLNNVSLLIILLCSSVASSQDSDWSLVTQDEDIIVSTRLVDDNPIKEVKIYAVFNAEADKILSSLNNVEGYTKWVYKCARSYKVKESGSTDYYYYSETDMPGLFSNRDLVVHSRQFEDQGIIYSVSTCENNLVDEIENNVRIKNFNSEWRINPINKNTTEIEYYVSVNPGGYLPAWLVNLGVSSGPLRTIKNLKNLVED